MSDGMTLTPAGRARILPLGARHSSGASSSVLPHWHERATGVARPQHNARPPQGSFIPAMRTTSPHFAVSFSCHAANSSGEPGNGTPSVVRSRVW